RESSAMSSRWRVPALAGAARLAGLATGGGTFAVWNTGSAVPQAVVTSGNLDIRAESTTWTGTSGDVRAAPHTIDPEEFLVRAGDTVAVRYEFSTQLQGDNMLGQLAVPGHQVGDTRLWGGRPPSALWRRSVL